ncbi:MAG TPA: hypothetical protein VFC44_11195 [Candidatus Saccharimonadales bacterium]|nr:hypothetical protein [Candidatus Saccharimonadales bacterium]
MNQPNVPSSTPSEALGSSPVAEPDGGRSSQSRQVVGRSVECRHWLVLAAAVLTLWGIFGLMVVLSLHNTGGHFSYAIDDAYISMAIARNFAQYGTWGIAPHEFASMASSPGWILLTAAVFWLFGPSVWAPLVMNAVFGTLLLVLIWIIFRSFQLRPITALIGLLLVLVLTPVVPVAFTGLEHLVQTFFDLGYIFAASIALGGDAPPQRRRMALAIMLLLSPLLTMIRYEGGFILTVAGCLLLARKQFLAFVLTGVLGLLPIVVSGLIFISHGWFFFPTSILLKGNVPSSANILHSALKLVGMSVWQLYGPSGSHMAVLLGLVLLGWLYLGRPMLASRLGVMVLLFFGTSLLHLELASLGWFYRYEAYLVCLGLVILVLLAAQIPWRSLLPPGWGSPAIMALSVVLLMEPLWARGGESYINTPIGSRNIYEQQVQMAKFLGAYYKGQSVAANDVGAISYFSGVHCLDLWGLGDATVARLKRSGKYSTSSIRELARQQSVKIAIVYDGRYDYYGGLPPEWVKAAEWTIADNHVCAYATVSFYAVDPAELPALRRHLQDFNRQLPKSVVVNFIPPKASL